MPIAINEITTNSPKQNLAPPRSWPPDVDSIREDKSVTDKSNFTPDEWKILLESVMAASIAITAAEPSGLWGLLKESFAGGTELAKAKTDPSTDALIKAVVGDFGTAEGRSITRDGLNDKLKGSKPAEIK